LKPIEPSPPYHSWPVYEREHRFVLGRILDGSATLIGGRASKRSLAHDGIGWWECDLARNALTWTDEVYDIFGLPRGARVSRNEAVALYCEHSRAVMEGLRAHAIKQRQGFILDAEIRPGHGTRRWMRLIAVPVCDNGRVVRLQGFKLNIPSTNN